MGRGMRGAIALAGWIVATVMWVSAGTAWAQDAATPKRSVMVIMDSSFSMADTIGGEVKMDLAKRHLIDALDDWPSDVRIGLVAFGHTRPADCSDIETVIPLSTYSRVSYPDTLRGLQPLGATPLAASIRHAAEDLDFENSRAGILVVSDGKDSCQANPCETVRDLRANGLDLRVFVVGLDIRVEEERELKCIASEGGGEYFPIHEPGDLRNALDRSTKELSERPDRPEGETPKAPPQETETQDQDADEPATSDDGDIGESAEEEADPVVPSLGAADLATGRLVLQARLYPGGALLERHVRWRWEALDGDITGESGAAKLWLSQTPVGRYRVTASYGTAVASEVVEVREGESHAVRLVLDGGNIGVTLDEELAGEVNVALIAKGSDDPVPAFERGEDGVLYLLKSGTYSLLTARGDDITGTNVTVPAGYIAKYHVRDVGGQLVLERME